MIGVAGIFVGFLLALCVLCWLCWRAGVRHGYRLATDVIDRRQREYCRAHAQQG